MAAASGLTAGLLAALIGGLLYALGLHQQGLGIEALLRVDQLSTPLFFFGGAFVLGEIHDVHARRFYRQRTELEELERKKRRLEYERSVFERANHRLKRRLVERPALVASLLEAAARLQRSGPDQMLGTALELVRELCGASMVSAWIPTDDGGIELAQSSGWVDPLRAERIRATRASPLMARTLQRGLRGSVLDSDERTGRNEPLMVAPISTENGVLQAVLCLDDIEPLQLHAETALTFYSIARFASAVVGRPPHTVPLRVGTPAALGERLRLEVERAARRGSTLSLLGVQAVDWRHADETAPLALDEELLRALGPLRDTDGVYRFGFPGCYVVVLPGTNAVQAGIVHRRASPGLTGGAVDFDAFVLPLDAAAPDAPSLVDLAAERFRAGAAMRLSSRAPFAVPTLPVVGDLTALLRRMQLEVALARRSSEPLHAVRLSVAARADRALRDAADRMLRLLRPIDGLYVLEPTALVLVLPATDEADARAVAARVVEALDRASPELGEVQTTLLDPAALAGSLGVTLDALAEVG